MPGGMGTAVSGLIIAGDNTTNTDVFLRDYMGSDLLDASCSDLEHCVQEREEDQERQLADCREVCIACLWIKGKRGTQS